MLLTPLTAPNHSQQHGLLFRMIFVCEQLLLWGREQMHIVAWETEANGHCCSEGGIKWILLESAD